MRKTLIYSHGAIFDNKLNPPNLRTDLGNAFVKKCKRLALNA